MIIVTPSPFLLLNVNDIANLICMGMGGPRLVLTWERDGIITVANGMMGGDTLQHNFTVTNDNFGNYTCNAVIDNMQTSDSVIVVGMYK